MAVEIVAINPAKKGGKKKGRKPMAEKKTKKKKTTKRKKRKNPSVKGAARAVGRRARGTIGGMNVKAALTGAPIRAMGMLACKWGAKKFPGVEGGGDKDDWSFSNYLAGGGTAFLAGFLAENFKKGSGQRVLEGGIDLLMYKLFENEIVPKNAWLSEQFGEDDEPIVLLGEDEDVEEGDLLLGDDGELYMMGADGYTRPVDERHRIMAAEMANRALAARPVNGYGGELQRPGALGGYGGELQRPGALGGYSGELQRPGALGAVARDPYPSAYQNQRW